MIKINLNNKHLVRLNSRNIFKQKKHTYIHKYTTCRPRYHARSIQNILTELQLKIDVTIILRSSIDCLLKENRSRIGTITSDIIYFQMEYSS